MSSWNGYATWNCKILQWNVRPRKKIFVFHVTQPTNVKNPRPKKVFLTFRQKSVFGRVFHKINCFALFSFYMISQFKNKGKRGQSSLFCRKHGQKPIFCWQVRKTFWVRGFLTWVGQVTWNTNLYFFPRPKANDKQGRPMVAWWQKMRHREVGICHQDKLVANVWCNLPLVAKKLPLVAKFATSGKWTALG